MDEKLLTALLLAVVVVVIFTLAARGWMRRTQREAAGPLPELPADLDTREPIAVVPGMYVATCWHRSHLQRVMAHHMGIRTSARVFVYPDGVLYDRDGALPVWVDAHAVMGHGTTSGMVGKFVERDGIVVLSWRWGDEVVDTGMRAQSREGKTQLLAAFDELAPVHPAPVTATKETP
ncbi:MAG: ABC transporter permease [Kocuria sp.]|nr:ABC transporter permease [Kocuria sp.]